MSRRFSNKFRHKIKQAYVSGTISYSELGRIHGIGRTTISRIIKEPIDEDGKADIIENPEPYPFNPTNPMVRSDAMVFIRKNKSGFTEQQLAKRMKTNLDNVKKLLTYLGHHDKFNLVSRNDTWQLLDTLPQAKRLEISRLVGKETSFGVISDTHFANKHCRQDLIEAAYDIFAKRGIKTVLHAGNIIDGEFRFNKYEILAHGAHNQSQFVADYLPQRKGIETLFVTGECHEGWFQQREGIMMGWYIQKVCEDAGRKDVKFIGHIEADIILKQKFGDTIIRMMHPGGGTPYALSYPSQKMVESFQGGEKPHVLILGHYHKFDVSYPREVVTILPGCLQDQTPFMRKRRLGAHLGFCILNVGSRPDGTIGRANVEWFPFYDKPYHNKLNAYRI